MMGHAAVDAGIETRSRSTRWTPRP